MTFWWFVPRHLRHRLFGLVDRSPVTQPGTLPAMRSHFGGPRTIYLIFSRPLPTSPPSQSDVELSKDNSSVVASRFRAYHTLLQRQSDYIGSLRSASAIADSLARTHDINVFAYSSFYIFFEQYLGLPALAAQNLGLAIGLGYPTSPSLPPHRTRLEQGTCNGHASTLPATYPPPAPVRHQQRPAITSCSVASSTHASKATQWGHSQLCVSPR